MTEKGGKLPFYHLCGYEKTEKTAILWEIGDICGTQKSDIQIP